MPTPDDLLGLGMPPSLSGSLGNRPQTITAAGTTQAGATAMVNGSHLFEMTATGADGIVVSSSAPIGTPIYVFNSSASTGLVYCALGQTMNTTSNGSVSVATHKLVVVIQYKKGAWASNLTA